MKSYFVLFVFFIMSFSAFGKSEVVLDLDQLKADKAHVLKAEMKRLQKMLGKTQATQCPDPDIDVDIDVDVDSRPTAPTPYCEARWSDGSCIRYGADKPATCYPNCEARWSDGSCIRYGADICL